MRERELEEEREREVGFLHGRESMCPSTLGTERAHALARASVYVCTYVQGVLGSASKFRLQVEGAA